jgi:hypothetical protein
VAKLVLNDIDNESVPQASATVNANNAAIEAALENTLSRDGTGPNQMTAPLDMNNQRILNVPFPAQDTDVVRRVDLATLSIPGPKGDPGPTGSGTGDVLASNNGSDFPSPSAFRTNLGLAYDVNVVAYRAVLEDIGDLTWGNSALLWKNGSGNVAPFTVSATVVTFLGGANAAALRSTLGLGGSATLNVGTAAGTVAAGNDGRFNRFTVTAGNSSSDLLLAWLGQYIYHTSASAHTFTIQPNATIAHPVGGVVVVRNAPAGGVVTLTRGSGVALTIAGQTTDKNVAVAPGGYCTLVQEATNVWVALGTGLS